ncbi:uncharacterized protein PHACADRAFT_259878 [Phanerochaete carnosa HHB-10118-sp]|uniref:BRCT domain-containing protein n=1 Tax=Phanerochaete carnosa (strain HHB-10118-sp) TaxID=650164 RepID=K5W3H3_PHACS|nr:uncharacterized protein PHACADRAFT_259878 [Phanerochaete carnosa HHB-10118-sp]EKM53469.1 hypothetical protein PHACADRAFT_259878 [Phanerochaete carnosa HHB-10118-sp]
MAEADEPAKEDEATVVATPMEDLNPFASGLSGTSSMLVDASRTVDTVALQQAEVAKAAYGGGSLRASKAFRSLTPFTVESPQTTPRRVPASEGKGKGRAVSSTFPSSSAQTSRTAPMIRGTGVGAHVARPQRSAALASPSTSSSPAGAVGSNTGTPTSANGAPQSSGILKGCVVFVDVKSEEGLDVSSLFTEMLQQLGAKILARVGQSCTHIVYKNGLASTSNRWRALNDPKPLVVGIAWVVACAERKEHVDEQKYLISMADENIAGTNKSGHLNRPKHCLPRGIQAGAVRMKWHLPRLPRVLALTIRSNTFHRWNESDVDRALCLTRFHDRRVVVQSSM